MERTQKLEFKLWSVAVQINGAGERHKLTQSGHFLHKVKSTVCATLYYLLQLQMFQHRPFPPIQLSLIHSHVIFGINPCTLTVVYLSILQYKLAFFCHKEISNQEVRFASRRQEIAPDASQILLHVYKLRSELAVPRLRKYISCVPRILLQICHRENRPHFFPNTQRSEPAWEQWIPPTHTHTHTHTQTHTHHTYIHHTDHTHIALTSHTPTYTQHTQHTYTPHTTHTHTHTPHRHTHQLHYTPHHRDHTHATSQSKHT